MWSGIYCKLSCCEMLKTPDHASVAQQTESSSLSDYIFTMVKLQPLQFDNRTKWKETLLYVLANTILTCIWCSENCSFWTLYEMLEVSYIQMETMHAQHTDFCFIHRNFSIFLAVKCLNAHFSWSVQVLVSWLVCSTDPQFKVKPF